VTGSVSYQDVGLKLEFEPQIYSDTEVGIKINLEVSTIAREISGPNGSLAYQIGTRNAQTVLRLRDGETQVLGGLISSEDRNTAAKVPGLGHLPVVGALFGNNNGTRNKTEIVLSITPHIVRPPALIDVSNRDVFSGTEGSIRQRMLQLDPVGAVRGQSGGSTPAPAAPLPGGSRPAATPPASTSLPASVATPAPAPVSAAPPAQAPAATPRPASIATPATAAPTAAAPSSPGSPAPVPYAAQYKRNLLPYLNGARNPANVSAAAAAAAAAASAPGTAATPEPVPPSTPAPAVAADANTAEPAAPDAKTPP
jgi:general secretion pathway protein D